jgi:hypothetical protein
VSPSERYQHFRRIPSAGAQAEFGASVIFPQMTIKRQEESQWSVRLIT